QQGLATRQSLRSALAAAPAAPLALEPMLLAGAAAANRGDARRAEPLLIEARRRNPRSPLVRAYLLDLYVKSGRFSEAAVELAALIRLVPNGAGDLFVPQLAYLAQSPGAASHVGRALKADPDVRQALLAHLVQNGTNPDLVVQIADKTKGTGHKGAPEGWQMPLVDRLVDAGQVDRAYRLWLGFNGEKPGSWRTLVRDGSFPRSLRPGPFGWQLSQGGAGVAELGTDQGLDVSYYRREGSELARQLLVLTPGQYRLSVTLTGNGPIRKSALAWRVKCMQGRSELMNLPLGDVSSATKQLASDFVVPAGCKGQWLALIGKPPEFSSTESVRFRAVDIRRLS
ncbi:MAG: tetratricopeptide repeat protein, partial [Pseudomonadota bacterium]|nr:tetratricopeptide repeat protein [Pseudomonadota bacterium]